jgi:hypothetical protein
MTDCELFSRGHRQWRQTLSSFYSAYETSERVKPDRLSTRTNVKTKTALIRISAAQAVMSQMRVDIPRRSANLGNVLTFMMPSAVPMPPPAGDG